LNTLPPTTCLYNTGLAKDQSDGEHSLLQLQNGG